MAARPHHRCWMVLDSIASNDGALCTAVVLRSPVVAIVRTSTYRSGHLANSRGADSSENQSQSYSYSRVVEGDAEKNSGRDADQNSEACANCRT